MTRALLSVALARAVGQVLTFELAKSIVQEAGAEDDRSIPVQAFGSKQWRGYTLRAERVAGNEIDLAPLHEAYHRETRVGPFDLAFDYARLRDAERAGTVAMFTARTADGELVGVMRVRVGFTLETQHMTACDDMFFVKPEHRGWLAIHLWKFAEEAMFGYGVREVTFDSLTINGAERMARFLGYQQVAIKFHKVAQEASNYSQVSTRHREGVAHEPLAPN
jgi:hypothetical protein